MFHVERSRIRRAGDWLLAGVPILTLSLTYFGCTPVPENKNTQIIENKEFISSVQCGKCHSEIFREWDRSAHAHAWQNPHIRAASNDFSIPMCRVCHSAHPILMTGMGKLPVWRDYQEQESIGCLTCHGLADGVATRNGSADRTAFCRPRLDRRIASVDLCGSCHNVTHFVVDEWRGSEFEKKGQDCNACHMPEVLRPATDGRPPAIGHSHVFPGHRDKAFLKSAILWSARLAGGKVEVTVKNRAGHQFPGEFPDREFHVVVSFRGAEKAGEEEEQWVRVEREVLKPPPRSARSLPRIERDRLDNRLRPGEMRAFAWPVPPEARAVRVRLVYKRFPVLYDGEGDLLGEWDGEVEGR